MVDITEQTRQQITGRQTDSGEDFSDLIQGIKESYHRTNVCDVDLTTHLSSDLTKRVGWLLQQFPDISNRTYRINFDPLQTLFLHKLVSEEILRERIVVTREDYFKGIGFIDFLTSILLNNKDVCQTYQEFERRLEQRDQFLDPDLEILVKYGSIKFDSLLEERLILKGTVDYRYDKRRFNQKNTQVEDSYGILTFVSPTYHELGKLVYGLFEHRETKKELERVTGNYDLKALLFIDSIVGFLEYDEKISVFELLHEQKYFEASVAAIEVLGQKTNAREVNNYIANLQTNYPGRQRPAI
ncbi:hypothetical protein HN587_00695 [Candidatus Woesearchaeota archaeon]|jgi:hypothetical protein|nr:hypothetical protein [Candidatus Woesearchaeota archaeon]